MKKLLGIGVVLLYSLLTGTSLSAATVNTIGCVISGPTPDLCATSIDGVVIDGNTYNVEFVQGTFNALNVDDNFPFYPGTSTDAGDAVTAINNALNAHAPNVERILPTGTTFDQRFFHVPYADGISVFVSSRQGLIGISGGDDDFTLTLGAIEINKAATVTWATFAVVPVPAAAWLFGSAVLGLVGVARRKRA